MQAKPGVVDWLNTILTIELTAVNSYFIQAEMCRNWGFDGLYEKLRGMSLSEMKDAQAVIRHILFLDGVPNLQRLNDIRVGENVLEDLNLDLQAELNIVDVMNQAIVHCVQVEDFTTRGILEEMVRDESEHVDWVETQLATISQIGIEHYLAQHLS
ncbi:MAG: bacterioferritin [Dehalococcoidia bacterium]